MYCFPYLSDFSFCVFILKFFPLCFLSPKANTECLPASGGVRYTGSPNSNKEKGYKSEAYDICEMNTC